MKTNDDDMTNRELFEATSEILGTIVNNMATKKDIQEAVKDLATKDDLKAFATKEDLKALAIKDDLKALATKEDIINGLNRAEDRLSAKINNLRIVSA